MSIICSTCTHDDVDQYDIANQAVEVGYGESLTFTIPADLSSGMSFGSDLPEGTVTIVASSEFDAMESIEAEHRVVDGCSTFTLSEPLSLGRHALHWAKFSTTKGESSEFMLGIRLDVEQSYNVTPESYTKATRSSGSGTIDDPIEVASPVTLQLINDNMDNDASFTTKGLYYKQVCDLNFFPYSITYSGFGGVCPASNRPFRGSYDGGGFTVKYLTISRFTEDNINYAGDETTPAAGLFCHVSGAVIENVNIEQPYIVGYNWVGALIGAVICETSLDMTYSVVSNCHLVESPNSNINSKIYGMNYVGGLIGGVDYTSGVMMRDCSNQLTDDCGTVIATRYAGTCLGGLVGGTFSMGEIFMYGCSNSLSITSDSNNSVGGLVGGGYKVTMAECENSGDISTNYEGYGVGGLVGGACSFYGASLKNSGDKVCGSTYLGGIIGTTLIYSNKASGSEGDVTYGNAILTSAVNYADVEGRGGSDGQCMVGGIMGAGQLSLTDGYNEGDIYGLGEESYSGGVVGYTPGGILLNANNGGYIRGSNAAGIVAYAYYYNIIGCNNTGGVYSTCSEVTHYEDFCTAGGILAFGGTNGVVNMCNNYGYITGGYISSSYYTDSGEYDECYVGGVVGRVGELVKDSRNLSNTAISSGVTGGLAYLDFMFILMEGGTQTHKTGLIGGACICGLEVIRLIKKVGEGIYECVEIAEEGEEFTEWVESLEGVMAVGCSEYKAQINKRVAENVAAISYGGKVKLNNNFDPMALALQNSQDFCAYLDDEENSSEMSGAINEELVEIAESEIKADLLLEGFKVAFELVVGAVSIAFGGYLLVAGEAVSLTLKLVKVGVSAVCELIIDWSTIYLENENNCIVVSQCSNFGRVDGNGIVGRVGDQVQVRHSLSAGPVSGYTLVQDDHNNTKITYGVVAGTPDHKAYHGYDGVNTIMDDWHSGIKDSNDDGYFEGYDDKDNYNDGFFDGDGWKLGSDFDFALIYKNRYMGGFVPSI